MTEISEFIVKSPENYKNHTISITLSRLVFVIMHAVVNRSLETGQHVLLSRTVHVYE
jgi:hypothetical protein